jgi:hypothetical protein
MIACRASSSVWALLVGAWLAACGDGQAPPARTGATTDDGGATGSGGGGPSVGGARPSTSAGESAAAEGGEQAQAQAEAGQAGSGGAPGEGDGGSGGEAEPGAIQPMFPCASDQATTPPAFDAECSPDLALGDASRTPVDAGNLAHLVAVTADELSIVWSSYGSSAITYFVADRADVGDDFDPPRQLSIAGSVVGLSADGLRLVTLDPEHKLYAESTRGARGDDFGPAAAGPFAAINAETDADGLSFEAGVLSADDRTFFYVALGSGGYPVRAATRANADDAFTIGEPLSQCELAGHDSLLRIPTGISSDGLTLFFFDPDRGTARAAWRSALDAPFTWFRDLPGKRVVVPGGGCHGVYYSQLGDGALMTASVR